MPNHLTDMQLSSLVTYSAQLGTASVDHSRIEHDDNKRGRFDRQLVSPESYQTLEGSHFERYEEYLVEEERPRYRETWDSIRMGPRSCHLRLPTYQGLHRPTLLQT